MKSALALLTVLASTVLAEKMVFHGNCVQPSNKCQLRFPKYHLGAGGPQFHFVDWPCTNKCTENDGPCSYTTDNGYITCGLEHL
ncbi:hypothetical protein JDV02_010638 [Purpureocillium takamizusanense]|uniref:Uncharacterized protein n=1 Tax=Purpureocillium takamizusanense TaxID=2060973 RepID=A0A9Q8VGS7_9HYPO|nr:uncharacterized protein JDV02_010638 [Purpureocillium takamizusanense]UNI24921.1 hypothetical protein JDV02_010638 [Purpureocillium takamizusanense]